MTPAGVRTAVVFKTRDKTWTDADGVTHRLAGKRRSACDPFTEYQHDLENKGAYTPANCIACLAGEALEGLDFRWAILQEADLEP